jgi:hypothetical protein
MSLLKSDPPLKYRLIAVWGFATRLPIGRRVGELESHVAQHCKSRYTTATFGTTVLYWIVQIAILLRLMVQLEMKKHFARVTLPVARVKKPDETCHRYIVLLLLHGMEWIVSTQVMDPFEVGNHLMPCFAAL